MLHKVVEADVILLVLDARDPAGCQATHIPSTIPCSGGKVAPGAETTCQAQIVNAQCGWTSGQRNDR